MRAVFAQETEKMRLGRAERIDGAVRPPVSSRVPAPACFRRSSRATTTRSVWLVEGLCG